MIKPEYKIFSKPDNNETKGKLFAKTKINNDYHIMRFQLPEENKCLGLKIGQYVWVQLDGDRRPYVPISSID